MADTTAQPDLGKVCRNKAKSICLSACLLPAQPTKKGADPLKRILKISLLIEAKRPTSSVHKSRGILALISAQEDLI